MPLLSVNGKTGHLNLQICTNNDIYITNDGDTNHTLERGCLVAGFFRGRWNAEMTKDVELNMKFELAASDDLVVYNGREIRVGTLVNQRRLTAQADEARVCYHELIDKPTPLDRSGFTLSTTQTVYFTLGPLKIKTEEGSCDVGPRLTQGQVGSALPPSAWQTKHTAIRWVVKWVGHKGLQPSRPQVHWACNKCVVEAGKALLL